MKKIFITIIRFYQKKISPFFGNRCRFHPSCSEYAIQAIQLKGICKGFCLIVWRLLRCNPLFKGGFDTLEEKK